MPSSPDHPILVRSACSPDIEAMSVVLIASIGLCSADHRDDPATIAGWTRNKSPDGVRAMLANPDLAMFVAERAGAIAAVGAITGDEVGLNYVAPSHRFKGVSKALLVHMEAQLRRSGIKTARLTSTATAHDFYRSAGWHDAGEPGANHAVTGYPMTKTL